MMDFKDDEIRRDEEQPEEGSLSSRLVVDKGREKTPLSRRKKVWITVGSLAGVLVLVLAGWLLLEHFAPKAEEPNLKLAELASKELIETIEMSSAEENFVLERNDEGAWRSQQKPDVKLDESATNSLTAFLISLDAWEAVDQGTDKLANYGLDDEQAHRVKVTLKDGTVNEYRVGYPTSDKSGYYLMRSGDEQIYVVAPAAGERLSSTFDSFRDLTLPTIETNNVSYFTYQKRGEEKVVLEYVDTPGVLVAGYTITSPYTVAADTTLTSELFEQAAATTLLSFVTDDETKKADYGLEDPYANFAIYDGSNNSLTVYLGDRLEDGSYYCQVSGMPGIYTVSDANLGFLDYSEFALMDKFCTIVDIASVDQLTLETEGHTDVIDVTRTPELDEDGNEVKDEEGNVTMEEHFTLNGKDAHERHTRLFYQDLISLQVDGEVNPDKVKDGEPVLKTTFIRNVGEKKIVTEYIPYDADYYAVRQNGETRFYLLKSRVQKVLDSLDEYRQNYDQPREDDT